MGEEVNIIIDNLCNKFGTTIQALVPEMAKMYIAKDIVSIAICVIFLVIIYKIMTKVWEYIKEQDCGLEPIILIPCLPLGIVVSLFCVHITDFVGWIASPMAKTIETIVMMIK